MTVYTFDPTGIVVTATNSDSTQCNIIFRETSDSPQFLIHLRESDIKQYFMTKNVDKTHMIQLKTKNGDYMFRSMTDEIAIQIHKVLFEVFKPALGYDVKMYVK